jgi:hypothetical protein
MASAGFEPGNQVAEDLRLRPRGHRDRHLFNLLTAKRRKVATSHRSHAGAHCLQIRKHYATEKH